MNNEGLLHNIIVRPMAEMDVNDIHNIHTDCLQTSLSGSYTPQQIET